MASGIFRIDNDGVISPDTVVLGADSWDSQSISSATITINKTRTLVTSASATDTLSTITYSTGSPMLAILKADSGKTITLNASGNIIPPDGTSFELSGNNILSLMYDSAASKWLSLMIDGGGGNTASLVRVYKNTDQSIPDGITTETNINWDAAFNETNSAYWDIANPDRLVAPYTGFYEVFFQAGWVGNTLGVRIAGVKTSSGNYLASVDRDTGYSLSNHRQQCVAGPFALSANDYVVCYVSHNRGSALDIDSGATSSNYFFKTWASMKYLGVSE